MTIIYSCLENYVCLAYTFLCPQVPKEKRLLPVPKLTETTEEQEKRSVNLGGMLNAKCVAASTSLPAMCGIKTAWMSECDHS